MKATLEEGGGRSARTHPSEKKHPRKKPEGETRLGRGPKSPPWRTTVLNLFFKARPLVIGAHVSVGPEFVHAREIGRYWGLLCRWSGTSFLSSWKIVSASISGAGLRVKWGWWETWQGEVEFNFILSSLTHPSFLNCFLSTFPTFL